MKEKKYRIVWIDDEGYNFGNPHSYEKAKHTADTFNDLFPALKCWIEEVLIENIDDSIKYLENCLSN